MCPRLRERRGHGTDPHNIGEMIKDSRKISTLQELDPCVNKEEGSVGGRAQPVWERGSNDGKERQLAKFMGENVGFAMQFLHSKTLCILHHADFSGHNLIQHKATVSSTIAKPETIPPY